MTSPGKMKGLQHLAEVVLDQRLLALRSANHACAETQKKIADLTVSGPWDGCSLRSAAQAELLYQAWAESRRRDLNLNLARQTATKMEAEDAARLAFARHTALQKLGQIKPAK